MAWCSPRRPRCATLLLVGVVMQVLKAHGLYMQGVLPPTSRYSAYAGKFCFDASNNEAPVGKLTIDVAAQTPIDAKQVVKLYLMLFDDEKKHWAEARKSWESWEHAACSDKMKEASYISNITLDGKTAHFNQVVYIREHVRPRFWYAAFVACGIPAGMSLNYELHATNDLWGWQKEFSYDHMGLIYFFVGFMGAFTIVTLATVWATRFGLDRSVLPPPTRVDLHGSPYLQLLVLLCLASSASCAFFLTHYFHFMYNGRGSTLFRTFGIVAGAVSNCTMLLIVALTSIGWAISYNAVPCPVGVVFAAVFSLAAASLYCEIRSEVVVDVSTKLYAYESTVGVLILMMKVLIFSWALVQIRSTYKGEWEERHRRFYRVLSVSIACWSLTAPIIAILAFCVAPWWRFGVVMVTELFARLAGVTLLAGIFSSPLSPFHRPIKGATGNVDATTVGMVVMHGAPLVHPPNVCLQEDISVKAPLRI